MEPGRYRLVAARACPWANRSIIVRRLLGLESAISMGLCGPTHDERSWTFDLDPDGRDPVLGYERLQEAYFARFPDYDKGITVPAIVDVPSGQVVTNDFPQITLDFSTQWTAHHRDGAPDLYPEALRDEIDDVMERIYTEVNNGVYRCGFSSDQKAYDKAYDRLFTALDWVSDRLADQRYLMGDTITEADVRLFTTLARFDAVYHGHFKCNRQKLTEFPVLWAYARDLFQTPGLRRHDRLRADQGALLRRPRGHQPDADHPGGPGHVGLADAARARVARRLAVRRRDAAGAGGRRRRGAGRSRTGRHPAPLADSPACVRSGGRPLVDDVGACGQLLRRVVLRCHGERHDEATTRRCPCPYRRGAHPALGATARPAGLHRPQPVADVARQRARCCRSSSRSTTSLRFRIALLLANLAHICESMSESHCAGTAHVAMALCRPGRVKVTKDDEAWERGLLEAFEEVDGTWSLHLAAGGTVVPMVDLPE